ncbi:MAG: hypothetical protein ACOC0X_04940, partial [Halobacteriota archaeon]
RGPVGVRGRGVRRVATAVGPGGTHRVRCPLPVVGERLRCRAVDVPVNVPPGLGEQVFEDGFRILIVLTAW